MDNKRNSLSSPLRIDAVAVPQARGIIGMTICPGKRGSSQYGPEWARDLDTDLRVIAAWGTKHLITAMETNEMDQLGVRDMGETARRFGLHWTQVPITDGDVPDHRFDTIWPNLVKSVTRDLLLGNRTVIHCRGGLGRTGLLSCLVLIELGSSPGNALQLVRTARPGTVETQAQQNFVLNYKAITDPQLR